VQRACACMCMCLCLCLCLCCEARSQPVCASLPPCMRASLPLACVSHCPLACVSHCPLHVCLTAPLVPQGPIVSQYLDVPCSVCPVRPHKHTPPLPLASCTLAPRMPYLFPASPCPSPCLPSLSPPLSPSCPCPPLLGPIAPRFPLLFLRRWRPSARRVV
jgi:hypothetical protein